MKLAEDPGDLPQAQALLCIIDVVVQAAACRGIDVAPQELAEKINRSFQILPQPGIQNMVYPTVLIAGIGARNVFALQF